MELLDLKHQQVGPVLTGEGSVRFPSSERVFAGHFPSTPILPGVVLIDTAIKLVSQAFGHPFRLSHLSSVKFCNAVSPNETIRFMFKAHPHPTAPDRIKVTGHWLRGKERIADVHFTAVAEEVLRG